MQLFLIGGEYRPDRMDTIGPMAVSTLNQVRGYTAFIGADGLSMDFGPSASDLASATCTDKSWPTRLRRSCWWTTASSPARRCFRSWNGRQIVTVITDKEPEAAVDRVFQRKKYHVVYPGSNGDNENNEQLAVHYCCSDAEEYCDMPKALMIDPRRCARAACWSSSRFRSTNTIAA